MIRHEMKIMLFATNVKMVRNMFITINILKINTLHVIM